MQRCIIVLALLVDVGSSFDEKLAKIEISLLGAVKKWRVSLFINAV
jgi:hypothetical protein